MMKFLDSMKMELSSFVEDGQFLMLFMVALLFLWLTEDVKKKEIRVFAFAMLLLLLCPVTAKLLMLYQTPFYGYENLWELLPVTVLLAYALVMAVFKMVAAATREYGRFRAAVSQKKERIYEILTAAVLTAVLFLCGTLVPGKAITEKTDGMGVIPKETEEVLSLLDLKDTQVTLLAPDEIAAWARIYSGDILLPYGRNLWEQELSAYTYDTYTADKQELHDWVNGSMEASDVQEEMLLSYCASNGYDYIVFSQDRILEDALRMVLERQKEYELFSYTDEYVIYELP
ncbi:MAG: hypothetical protein UFG06_11835 [Lachnospiraceae bacterium]|nr:hypothetical protein [Lachnospiraceae bacterium]